MYFTIEHDVCTIIDNKVIKLRFEFWRYLSLTEGIVFIFFMRQKHTHYH